MKLTTCTGCKVPTDVLDVFPGGLCVTCYANSPAGERMPTAAEVTVLWGGRA